MTSFSRIVVDDFLKHSKPCIQNIVDGLRSFQTYKKESVRLLNVKDGQIREIVVNKDHFFLRSSVEYSSPLLSLEEAQGIVAARLLEACGNYFCFHDLQKASKDDVDEICEMLSEPPKGKIVPFLLNTDDIEPDRYSANPLRTSIVETGQSAFPSAYVRTNDLRLDDKFVKKYDGSLISKSEEELIEHYLSMSDNSYVNFVDSVKQSCLESLSKLFNIDLCLPVLRMPLTTLKEEGIDGLLHYIIREAHKDYESIEKVYNCMGRSLKNRTTLLTVPHSKKGFGSKRAARGKIYFDGNKLKNIQVTYQTTPLYPNDIDSKDVSIAVADDQFVVDGEKILNYDYRETPSSPQFILYSLGSPEDAAIWHGIGESGASQLVKSYTSIHVACQKNDFIPNLEKYGVLQKVPLQFNLIPEKMWTHPVHGTIDTSIGSVKNPIGLARFGMRIEFLSPSEFMR
ncbi:hypothetical protein KEJ18_04005 [Candidatus Bathyarchaeota archaeon]|nr:hypothetical protein [Candidatus Bathyarchaeota archaeon]